MSLGVGVLILLISCSFVVYQVIGRWTSLHGLLTMIMLTLFFTLSTQVIFLAVITFIRSFPKSLSLLVFISMTYVGCLGFLAIYRRENDFESIAITLLIPMFINEVIPNLLEFHLIRGQMERIGVKGRLKTLSVRLNIMFFIFSLVYYSVFSIFQLNIEKTKNTFLKIIFINDRLNEESLILIGQIMFFLILGLYILTLYCKPENGSKKNKIPKFKYKSRRHRK